MSACLWRAPTTPQRFSYFLRPPLSSNTLCGIVVDFVLVFHTLAQSSASHRARLRTQTRIFARQWRRLASQQCAASGERLVSGLFAHFFTRVLCVCIIRLTVVVVCWKRSHFFAFIRTFTRVFAFNRIVCARNCCLLCATYIISLLPFISPAWTACIFLNYRPSFIRRCVIVWRQ